jgi:hypothetical protein
MGLDSQARESDPIRIFANSPGPNDRRGRQRELFGGSQPRGRFTGRAHQLPPGS